MEPRQKRLKRTVSNNLITIGDRRSSSDDHAGGGSVVLDASSLIYSRALIQANSGGGKTGLLRVIAEQVAVTIPTIIIDKEGEFYTLREKLDLVLVSEQGELAADVRSAGLLARKLIELGASAVIDLSGLKAHPQQEFVKRFLESLMDLPRKLWHPTLIMIDEAHLFCPERSMGESASTDAVIDLMTRGRKRGFGGVLATTRLSKLHKNAADANNVFIGRTVLDVDQVRAGKNLGMKGIDILKLRDLEVRDFYAYGPDLNYKGVEIFRVADAQTTMPKPGAHKSLAPPKASHVVLEIADKLKDIEQEAEVEIRDLNTAKSEVAKLKRELRTAKSAQAPREQDIKRIAELTEALEKARTARRTKTEKVEKRIVMSGDLTRLEKAKESFDAAHEHLRETFDRAEIERSKIAVLLTEAREINEAANKEIAPQPIPVPSIRARQTEGYKPTVSHHQLAAQLDRATATNRDKSRIGKGEIITLRAIVQHGSVARNQLTILTGYKRSTRDAYLQRLSTWGLIGPSELPGEFSPTEEGIARAGEVDIPPTGRELIEWWLQRLPGGEREVFEFVVAHGGSVAREEIDEATGYARSSRDAYLQRLASRKLIEVAGPGTVRPAAMLS